MVFSLTKGGTKMRAPFQISFPPPEFSLPVDDSGEGSLAL